MSRPSIQVTQQSSSTAAVAATAELNTVLVGECYNVLTYADNHDAIAYTAADYGITDPSLWVTPLVATSAVNIADTARPGHVTGAILDDSSVQVYLDDCYVVMDQSSSSGTATVATATPYLITVTGTLQTDSDGEYLISPGDKIVYEEPATNVVQVRTVQEVLTASTFTVTSDFTGAILDEALSTWRVIHQLDGVTVSVSINSADQITITGDQSYTYRGGSRKIDNGSIFVEYRELRQDLSADVSTYANLTAALAGLGPAVADNPLGLAAQIYFANAPGVDLRVLAVTSDDSTGHTEAISVLEARSDVYFIGVLSNSSSILASYKAHAEAMSLPEVSKFRVAAGGGTLVTTSTITASKTNPTLAGSVLLVSTGSTFITSGVAAGDIVTVTGTGSGTNDGTYTVAAVLSEERLNVTSAFPGSTADGAFTITRALDKQGQTDNLETVPESFDSKRMILVWPDSITVDGVSGIAGFFLVAALGGMVSSQPSHQGFTNMGIAGVDSLANSNFYFTNSQIDELSAAGWYVFIQESTNGLPFAVHQKTTSSSGLVDEIEFSVVKNFDYISQRLIDKLNGFVGRWNINEENLGIIRGAIEGEINLLTKEIYPRIGARLNSGSVDSMSINSSVTTRVDAYVTLDMPKPLNTVMLYLISA